MRRAAAKAIPATATVWALVKTIVLRADRDGRPIVAQ